MDEQWSADPEIATPRILAVDDDPDIRSVVRFALEAEGLRVTGVGSGQEALEWIGRHGLPHLALIDIMMPGQDGLSLAREILEFCDLPIIFLTAIGDSSTKVSAIEELAEDYVTKPFDPRELAARVKRLLRRVQDFSFAQRPRLQVDSHLAVDFVRREAYVRETRIDLTPTETKLLHILIKSKGRTVTSDFLLRRLWPREEVFEDTLRVHVHRLRKKIEIDHGKPRYLVTQRGLGYCFLPEA